MIGHPILIATQNPPLRYIKQSVTISSKPKLLYWQIPSCCLLIVRGPERHNQYNIIVTSCRLIQYSKIYILTLGWGRPLTLMKSRRSQVAGRCGREDERTTGSTAGKPTRVSKSTSRADLTLVSSGVSQFSDGDRFTSNNQGLSSESIRMSNPYSSDKEINIRPLTPHNQVLTVCETVMGTKTMFFRI